MIIRDTKRLRDSEGAPEEDGAADGAVEEVRARVAVMEEVTVVARVDLRMKIKLFEDLRSTR